MRFFYLIAFILVFSSLKAQNTSTISYQGCLEANGGAVHGEHTITATLYADETGTTPIWSDRYVTYVQRGIVNLQLGSGATSLPNSLPSPLWLGIRVGESHELRPFTRIASVPSALTLEGGAVKSINGRQGEVTLKAGSGTILEAEGNTITISAMPITKQESQAQTLSVSGGGTGITSITNNGIMIGHGTSNVSATSLTNGQLLIGSSSESPVAASLTGTANQVIVSNGAGSITLSTPQNISTSSSPIFQNITLTAKGTSDLTGSSDGAATLTTKSYVDNADNALSASIANEANDRSAADQTKWSLSGNTGTTPETDFIGTTDSIDFIIRTNSIERLRVTSDGNLISALNSVSLGSGSIASADHAVVFGQDNIASGHHSAVSGGINNTASGVASVVGGGGTDGNTLQPNIAIGDASVIAGGCNNQALGGNTTVGGGGTNTAHAFWSTVAGGVFNNAVGNGAVVAGGFGNNAEGNFSYAYGFQASAIGFASIAIGSDASYYSGSGSNEGDFPGNSASANGEFSLAIGNNAYASGYSSTAIGWGNATGDYSFATGRNTTASGHRAVALGNNTISSGLGAFAQGESTVAIGNAAAAFGYSSAASGDNSIAAGYQSSATAEESFAFGLLTLASDVGAVAMGVRDSALGNASIALGYQCIAEGAASVATGFLTKTGELSFASGAQLLVGDNSFGFNYRFDDTVTDVSSMNNIAYFGNVDLIVGNDDGIARDLRFYEPNTIYNLNGTNYTAFKAQSQSSNITYTLPATAPTTNGVLSSTNTGTLTWSSHGQVTAVAGTTQVINNAAVTTNSTIIVIIEGTVTFAAVTARVAGTSFTVTTGAALVTTDRINYQILP